MKQLLCFLSLLSLTFAVNAEELSLKGKTKTMKLGYYPKTFIEYVMVHGDNQYHLIDISVDEKVTGIASQAKISSGDLELKSGKITVPKLEIRMSPSAFQTL